MPNPATIEAQVCAWLREFVVGLDLCPFARPLLDSPQLRIRVSVASAPEQLQGDFLSELDRLQSVPEDEIATTLLVFGEALQDFDDYLRFLDDAREWLRLAGLEGLVQLASFHPHYLFEGEDPAGASHYSNRSPWPVIHLIREDMLARVLESYPDPEAIPGNNIRTLEAIGRPELERRLRAISGPWSI